MGVWNNKRQYFEVLYIQTEFEIKRINCTTLIASCKFKYEKRILENVEY